MTDRTRPRTRVSVEIVATALLAVAAVATAWCSYQATRRNGEQAKASAAASSTRFQAARSSDLANAQTEVDVATFSQWVDAYARNAGCIVFLGTIAWVATFPISLAV